MPSRGSPRAIAQAPSTASAAPRASTRREIRGRAARSIDWARSRAPPNRPAIAPPPSPRRPRARMTRLHILGDGELGDLLGEIAGRLGYDEIRRGDDPPKALGEGDHVVVCARDPGRSRELLARVLAAGDVGYLGLAATE